MPAALITGALRRDPPAGHFQFLFLGSRRNRAASGSVGGRYFVNRLGGKLFTYFA